VKLRARLLLTSAAIGIPFAIAMFWIDQRSKRSAAELALQEVTSQRVSEFDAKTRCLADPAAWSSSKPQKRHDHDRGHNEGHDPHRSKSNKEPHGHNGPKHRGNFRLPVQFVPFSDQLIPAVNSGITQAIAGHRELSRATDQTFVNEYTTDGYDVALWFPTGWGDGPCKFLLAQGTIEPWLGSVFPAFRAWLLPLLLLFASILIAAGPTLRRIRKLQESVQLISATDFDDRDKYLGDVDVTGNDEISALAKSFANAHSEVQQQSQATRAREQALRTFIANTTHDVMTPLTVLQGHLAQMQNEQKDLAAAASQPSKTLTSALREVHYIGSLLRNLSTVAKLDATESDTNLRVQHESVDLGGTVERVVARHKPVATQAGVVINSGVPDAIVYVVGDVTLIEQALNNLVSNAIRYNNPGGHVAVTLHHSASTFELQVLDDGDGVDEDELDQLLHRGYRSNQARTRSPEGQGIGLHIVARIADLHEWNIRFARPAAGGLQVSLSGRCEVAMSRTEKCDTL
jgi:two-component system, OmpR family, sensor histidine kinase BaeS